MNRNEEFSTKGFTLFRNVLSPYEVQLLRTRAIELFDHTRPDHKFGDAELLRTTPFERWPEIRSIVLQPKVRLCLAELFGPNYVMLPSNSLCDRRYSGWHKDIHGQQKHKFNFQTEPDFIASTIIIYLQDNTTELGGGLDIVPGSHLEADRHAYSGSDQTLGKVEFGKTTYDASQTYTIPSKAGDMIVFDIRLNHKATWPSIVGPMENLYEAKPPQHPNIPRKFLVSMKIMPQSRHVLPYLEYFRFMADLEPSMSYLKDADITPLNTQFA